MIRPATIDSHGNPGIAGTTSGVVLDDVTIVEVWTCIEVAIDELLVALLLTVVLEVVDAMFDEGVADVVDVELEPEFSEASWGSCVHIQVCGGVVRVTLLPASAW
jgi:hypothetical protein